MIEVYTDGSCYPNPNGVGGWAFVAKHEAKIVKRYGHIEAPATTNRAELTAIREALIFVRLTGDDLIIYTDSKYSGNAIMRWVPLWKKHGWTNAHGEPVQNRDLLEEIDDLVKQHREVRAFSVGWVKGHAGNPMNEEADRLASMGRKKEGHYIPWSELY